MLYGKTKVTSRADEGAVKERMIQHMKTITRGLFCLCIGLLLCGCFNSDQKDYEAAKELYSAKKYQEAYNKFTELGEYEDARELASESAYLWGQEKFKTGAYEEAIDIFSKLGNYRDSKDLILQCEYFKVVSMIDSSKYEDAKNAIGELRAKMDVTELTKQCDYAEGVSLFNNKDYSATVDKLLSISGYLDTDTYLIKAAEKLVSQKDYDKAKTVCKKLPDNKEIIKLKDKIAYAKKYEHFKKGKGPGQGSKFRVSYSAKETEKFLKEKVYGTWKDYYTGKSYKVSKYMRGGKPYGIYSACEDTGWIFIYYYYEDDPDKIYSETYHIMSVPGGLGQPFLESYKTDGFKDGDYVYAKMTEDEMDAYANQVAEYWGENYSEEEESDGGSSSTGNSSNNDSNSGIDEDAMFSFAKQFIGNAIQDTLNAGEPWEFRSNSHIDSAYGGDSVYRVSFKVYFTNKHSEQFVHVYLKKNNLTGNYEFWKGGDY